jgi:tetratricopeptide (TPR) repeat protein
LVADPDVKHVETPHDDRRLTRRALLGLFGFALLVRVIHVLQVSDAPVFGLMMGDAEVYDAWARTIADGDWIGKDVFWYAPLYPYFMGTVYTLLGTKPITLALVQALIGAGSCALLAAGTARLFGRRAGVLAGLILALYAPAIFYDSVVAKPVVAMFFLALVLWQWSRLQDTASKAVGWLAMGAAMGALILSRENTMAFVPVFLVWMGWHYRSQGTGRRLVLALCFVVGLSALLLPVALRNQVVGGEFHLTAANFGDNFYKGNNPDATGTYMPLKAGRANPRFEREDATAMAQEALGRALTPAEVSAWLTDQSLTYIRDQPLDWLRLTGRKFVLFWNRVEPPDTVDQYTHAESSILLTLLDPVFNLGVLAPLSVLGLLVLGLRRRSVPVFVVLAVLYTGSIVAFYIFGRYRYPIVGLLIPIAAAGLLEIPRVLANASMLRKSITALVTVGFVVLCHWPLLSTESTRAITHNNLGTTLSEAGKFKPAIRELEQAVALQPGFVGAHYNLAVVLEQIGQLPDARRHYEETVRLSPSFAQAHNNLGALTARQGDTTSARIHFENALRIRPGYSEAHNNLGNVFASTGQLQKAEAQYRLATAGKAGAAPAHLQLGQLARRQGRLKKALEHFQEAADIRPDWPPALTSMAILLATHTDPAIRNAGRAVSLAERAALLTNRQHPGVLDVLATAYAANHQLDKAISNAEEALKVLGDQGPAGMIRSIRRRLEDYRHRAAAPPMSTP